MFVSVSVHLYVCLKAPKSKSANAVLLTPPRVDIFKPPFEQPSATVSTARLCNWKTPDRYCLPFKTKVVSKFKFGRLCPDSNCFCMNYADICMYGVEK